MPTNPQDAFPKLFLIPASVVVSIWVWVAVHTEGALQIISRGVIPYSRRTVWLLKILALIVGGGGATSLAQEFGAPWFLAIVPAGAILFFAAREKVAGVVPPRPAQDASAYEMAWQEYDRLRKAYMRSLLWFGVAFLTLIQASALAASWSSKLPQSAQMGLVAIFFTFCIASSVLLTFNQMKWYRWPCPRCGCAFRGLWRLWLPKRCVYCGLEREERNRN